MRPVRLARAVGKIKRRAGVAHEHFPASASGCFKRATAAKSG
jgi:hypothetical protein